MKRIAEDLMRKYVEAEAKMGFRGASWEKYLRGKVAAVVEMDDGVIFGIEKESVETRFCFGESGYDMDDAVRASDRARTDEEWFKAENLRKIDGKIADLEDLDKEIYIIPDMPAVGYFYLERHINYSNGNYRQISNEERGRLLDAFKAVREDFSKRIDNYLKRYGLSKVHSWTYWRDA